MAAKIAMLQSVCQQGFIFTSWCLYTQSNRQYRHTANCTRAKCGDQEL